ncbi:MAG: TorF family putative porin [Pacificimonas sp.]
MTKSVFTRGAVACALLTSAAMLATTAQAQTGLDEATDTDIPSDWELSGNVNFVTDYRFRGISFSDEDIALQGGLDVAHSSGFYAGTWASNLGGFGTFGDPNLELDLYAGFGGDFGGIGTFDVGALYYLYPGAAGNNDYIELYGSVGAEIAGAEATVGIAYAPDQDSIGDDNFYAYGDLGYGIPNTPVSLTAHLGWTDGSLGFGGSSANGFEVFDNDYLDWSLGIATEMYGLSLGLTYVDTNIGKTRENVVGTRVIGSNSPFVADSQIVGSIGYSF